MKLRLRALRLISELLGQAVVGPLEWRVPINGLGVGTQMLWDLDGAPERAAHRPQHWTKIVANSALTVP